MAQLKVEFECFLMMAAAMAACEAGEPAIDHDGEDRGQIGGKADCIGEGCNDCSVGAPSIGSAYLDYRAPGVTDEGLATETPLETFYDMVYGTYEDTDADGSSAYDRIHLTKEVVTAYDPFDAEWGRAHRYWAAPLHDNDARVEGFWWVRYSGSEDVDLQLVEWTSESWGSRRYLTGLSNGFAYEISEDSGQYEWGFDPAPYFDRIGCANTNPPMDCHTPHDDGHRDYCSADCPCDEGEGDCDDNDECGPGLACQQGPDWDDDICVVDDGCVNEGCSRECPCDEGEGDCNWDTECAEGLRCVEDVGAQHGHSAWVDICLPGATECAGAAHGGIDSCTHDCPCPAGGGDCDHDGECELGLTCEHDVGDEYGFEAWIDVCT